MAKLQITEPFCAAWETPHADCIPSVLQQEYSFLGKGAQSYVFQSQDGRYVLKLFRSDHGNIESLFQACLLALFSAPEETGLLYLHLNKTDHLLPVVTISDPLHRRWRLPLDQYRFAIQKKGSDLQEGLRMAKDLFQMQAKIDQVLSLLKSRAAKNIVNTDPNLLRNFGFLEDRAIELDFGNYRYAPHISSFSEIDRYVKKLRKWLQKEAPSAIPYLDEQIEQLRCAF